MCRVDKEEVLKDLEIKKQKSLVVIDFVDTLNTSKVLRPPCLGRKKIAQDENILRH